MTNQYAMRSITPDELREELSELTDGDERLEFIIEFGDDLPALDEQHQCEANRVQGCLSNVWLVADVQADPQSPERTVLRFLADSDAVITRGLIAIIVALIDGKTASEILAIDIDALFTELELQKYLTRMRSNGLRSMVSRVNELARSLQ